MAADQPDPETRRWIESVVEQNGDDLLRYLRRRVDQPEDAADLLGHVLLAIWKGARQVPKVELDARLWCFGIARNTLREHHRRTARRLALADDLRDRLRVRPHGEDAAEIAEAQFAAAGVRKALTTLDDRSRELITLVHWDGFSIAEAARMLGMNESTARTRYGRALRRLQAHLAAESRPPADARRAASAALSATEGISAGVLGHEVVGADRLT
ncbi:RNA polymerase sigma factor [Microbacterium gorillae]|uniref:RNA polymerase sigma factor n=1 Tax=Microbacterium gorillae TaxID=1231063 RepID=UPI0006941D19|nr:sigma-70 family RNA polymerase sigma factor [Microbacterium gorillae]